VSINQSINQFINILAARGPDRSTAETTDKNNNNKQSMKMETHMKDEIHVRTNAFCLKK